MGTSASQFSEIKRTSPNGNLATAENSLAITQREIDREFRESQDMTSKMLRKLSLKSPDQKVLMHSAYVTGEAFAAGAHQFKFNEPAQTRQTEDPQPRHKAALAREKLNMLENVNEYDPIKTLERK